MSDTISSGKYGIAVMANLERAFDTVWREGAIYKLQKAGINNNLFSAFSGFLSDRYSRNLVNSQTSDWFQTTLGVPQSSILSPVIFLVYAADLLMEEVLTTAELYPEIFWGTPFFKVMIFPYRHHGCLRVRKLRVFNTSDLLKTYSVESNT